MRFPTQTRRSGGGGGIGLPGGRLGLIVIGLIGVAVYWFSNQKEIGFTGRKQFNTVSVEQEKQLGEQAYAQILQQEGRSVICGPFTRSCDRAGQEVVEEVRRIGERLEAAALEWERELAAEGRLPGNVYSQFDWTYNVILSDQPNAFCLPGGYVAIYTRMIDLTGDNDGRFEMADLDDPDMLAAVMGHEIGHALAHHGAERMSQQKVVQLGSAAIALGAGGGDSQAIMGALGFAGSGVLNAFSRKHESEADLIGLELMVRACFDPRDVPTLWRRMAELGGGQRPPEWMSTHPDPLERAKAFEAWMPDAIRKYEANCGPLPPR